VRKRVSGYNDRMEFFLTDSEVTRLPPADTRLLNLHAEFYPDGKRLRVSLGVTPYQQKPYLEVTLTNSIGEIVAATSIVEPVAWKLEFTLHIRKPDAIKSGAFKLTVVLSYLELGEIDRREITVEIPTSSE